MSELNDTITLAGKVLDRANADPDDDLAMLSRQFFRARAMIDRLREELGVASSALVEAGTLLEGQGLRGCGDIMRTHAKRASEAAHVKTPGAQPDCDD